MEENQKKYSVEDSNWRDIHSLRHLEKVCFTDDAWPLSDLMGVLLFPGVVRLKAVAEGELIGFIAGDPRNSLKIGWILTLGVLPEWRRMGIAQALLSECESRLKMDKIKLTVRRGNDSAIRLYEKLGYRQVNIWRKYYRNGEDGLVLEKEMEAKI